jgi:hypothetical protein
MQEHYQLAEGVSEDKANLIINATACKVLKECLQACPLHLYCLLLYAGEFTSLLHACVEVVVFYFDMQM